MVNCIWLVGSGSGADALCEGLHGRGFAVVQAAGADALDAAPTPAALVYLAPRAPAGCAPWEIAGFTAGAVSNFIAAVQRATRRMAHERDGGGAIAVLADIAGVGGRSGHAPQATLSGALIGAAKCLAKELGRQRISVNLLGYGVLPALGAADDLSAPQRRLFEMMNLGKPGELDHLLENLVHLIGNRHLMTGQVLHVDDGLFM